MVRAYIVYFVLFCSSVVCLNSPSCNYTNALKAFQRPTYEFSIRILENVAWETDYHFVFSPFSTWWQLMMLAEGARGKTRKEIWQVIKYHRKQCFRRKYKKIINEMDQELNNVTKRSNIVIINKLLNIKKTYEKEAMKSHTTKILPLDFNDHDEAADKVNEIIEMDMNDVIRDRVLPDDFDMTLLFTTGMAYFKSDWQFAFDPVYTSTENFYKSSVAIGKVRLMTQVGYFKIVELPIINARVVELPFNSNNRLSMLVFLPIKGIIIDLFYSLKRITLKSIYNTFEKMGPKYVTVKLPRFKITTEIDNMPELLNDLGITRIFYRHLADFGGITEFKVFTSLLKQTTDISVTEEGVKSSVSSLIKSENNEIFSADRPFAYLIVDKKTETIQFAGMYTKPSIY